MSIENNIRYYAHIKGLKLYEVANKIGLSSSGSFSLTIRKDMRLSTLQKIADALDVPITALLEDEPNKTEAANKFLCPRCGALLKVTIKEDAESPEKPPKTDK
ncbi:MAG: helix-turn-helix domain-containing protein [Bacteroidaceae bacterium]|nr:helix-turn-helix domain-containing protein [Bacteroidaceae bacterium]